jgi:tRNA (guanine-N7-)-methyltransferase
MAPRGGSSNLSSGGSAVEKSATGGGPSLALLAVEALEKPLSWESIFGRKVPVELEIGSGKGHFLTTIAALRPDSGFFGIERSQKWALHAATRAEKAGLPNVRFTHAEAIGFLEEFVASSSVAAVHVYFPDPWPKRKHEKRRIWGDAFVREILRVLEPNGHIHIATDVRAYFLAIQETLSGIAALEQVRAPRSWPITGYARKYLAVGRPVFGTMFAKREPMDESVTVAGR